MCVTVLYCDALLLSETFVASVGIAALLLDCMQVYVQNRFQLFHTEVELLAEIIITCANSAD